MRKIMAVLAKRAKLSAASKQSINEASILEVEVKVEIDILNLKTENPRKSKNSGWRSAGFEISH